MSITTVKVLRTISKIVLLVVGICIIGYGGLMIYKSVSNKPQRVRITNVTDSAATITWVTDNPVRGIVYYRNEGSFLPGPLGVLGSKIAYDDRDFALAQDECVKAFNENAKNTKDGDFAVDGNTFNCENISVEKLGAYYTHSVTIKDLNESSTYFFMVGNGIWSWNVNGVDKDISDNDIAVVNSFNFKTSQLLEEVPTPNIAYGTVYAGVKSEEGYLSESLSKDSFVFAYLTINGVNSQIISAVTNTDGGWTFDKSNFRDAEGNLITDLSKAKMMVRAQYEDVEDARWVEIEEDLDSDTEMDLQGNLVDDLNEAEKSKIKEKFEMLMGKVYAEESDAGLTCVSAGIDKCDGHCVDKCYIPGTDIFKWVQRGAVGTSSCPKPPICGCTPGTCEEKCELNQRKTCMSGHYWSVWVNGSCNPSKCDGDGVNKDDCTSDELGDCKNGKKCKLVNGFRKWVADTSCVNKDDCTLDELGDCKNGEKCKLVNGYRKWVADENCGGGTTESTCTDGTTVGKCNSKGEKCITAGENPVPDKCDVVSEQNCTIIPNYSESEGVFHCLPSTSACTLKCDSREGKKLSSDDCTALGKKRCLNTTEYADNSSTTSSITFQPIDLQKASDLKILINADPAIKDFVNTKLENLKREINTAVGPGTFEENKEEFKKYCKALGGNYNSNNDDKLVNCDDLPVTTPPSQTLVLRAYAEEESSSAYTLYLPEYGMYSFELGDYQLKTDTTSGNTYYIFYIEANDKAGFQMPKDPDNPTAEEDIMLKSSSAAITYEKVASSQSYTLVKGINLISFNFIPVAKDLGPLTAKGIMDEAAKKDVTIQYISSFDGGRWSKGYTCKNDKCSGNDFNILPGKGYLVYATKGGEMTIPGYNLKSSVPVSLSGGWNLVGIHGYTNAYTAASLIDSMNKIDGVTANNVTWWPTSKGMYEGLQVTGEQQYGFDFPISSTNGYFVRISSFKPEDSKCKSLLWNEGGALNGKCGIIK